MRSPERLRLVLGLHYQEDASLRRSGEVLGVTESRACQLHSEARFIAHSRAKWLTNDDAARRTLETSRNMSDGIWAAASGATSQLTILDAAANNVANANTIGYKSSAPVFEEVVANATANAGAGGDVRLTQSRGTARPTRARARR